MKPGDSRQGRRTQSASLCFVALLLYPDLLAGCEDLTPRRRDSQRVAGSSSSLRFSAILFVSALRPVWRSGGVRECASAAAAPSRGDSQRRTRPVKRGTHAQLTCPCCNRQMSGCPHACQRSSMGPLPTNKSWIASINNMFSLGMTGWVVVGFNGVRFNSPYARRHAGKVSRIRRRSKRVSENSITAFRDVRA